MKVLADIEELLHLERRLFGETLLVETAPTKEELVTPRSKKPDADDLLLFDDPHPAKQAITTEPWGRAETLGDLEAHACSAKLATIRL